VLIEYLFLRAFPGYTVDAMREEDAETVESLLALHEEEMRARADAMKAEK
jgi:hypothetical protein